MIKNTDKPLLSICIPTYNRARYLKECMNSIVCQFADEDIYRQVEIVISDNASEDNTSELVKEYQEKYHNIKYFKNKENLGYDRNVIAVMLASEGAFVWTLSDDESLKVDTLISLFDVLNKYPEIAWICVSNGNSPITAIQKYDNGDDWLNDMGLAGGQISQNIYNRAYLPLDMDKYVGSLWIHYALAREAAAMRPQLLVKNLFLTPEKGHPCTWAKGGKIFLTIIGLNKIIRNLPSFGYDKKTVYKILKKLAIDSPRQVASAKINGLDTNVTNLKLLIVNFYPYPVNLLIAIFIFFIPRKFIIFLKSLCQKK